MNNQNKQLQTVIDCRIPLPIVNIRVICIDQVTRISNKNGNSLWIWKVADHTGSINLCVWDKHGECIQVGDILLIEKGYSNKYNNSMHLYTSQKGRITKVDEFCMPFVEIPNISQPDIPEPMPMGIPIRAPVNQ